MAAVAVGAGGLHVEEVGDGFPLLLVQGLGNSSWAGRSLAAALAPRRRVILFDNRCTGRSFKSPPPETLDDLVDDTVELLGRLGVERADVLGHSMGGYISISLALRRPELVRSLVLMGTGPGAPTHAPVPKETLETWLANAHLPPAEYARATMHLSFAPGWTDEHPEHFERLLAARLEHPTPPEGWRAQYEAATNFVERGARVEEIRVPTLVVHGERDRVVPVENGRALARRIPDAELVVLPGIGHYPQFEAPERLAELVGGFLDRVG